VVTGPHLTEAEGVRIRHLARAQKSAAQIAREIGRTPTCVSKYAERCGIMLTSGRRPFSDDEICAVMDLAGDGFPAASIATVLGRSIGAVNNYARRGGISFGSGKGKQKTAAVLVSFEPGELHVLQYHADRFRMSKARFILLLVRSAIAGHMVDAVLDLPDMRGTDGQQT
jgi:predicted transcriptional regulator